MKKYTNINIISTGAYIPTKKVENEYFIKHFAERGINNVEHLLQRLNKKNRYFTENGETSLSMGHEAALMALEGSNVTRNDIDMIIFVSAEPEFLNPTTSMILRDLLKAHNAHTVFDINDTGLGGITGINTAAKYALTNDDINTALIVCAQNISPVVDKEDSVAYSILADSAVAMILQKEKADIKKGFINNVNFCRGAFVNNIKFPSGGLTKALSNTSTPVPKQERNFTWNMFNDSWVPSDIAKVTEKLLKKSQIAAKDIDYCFMSQLCKDFLDDGLKKVKISPEKNFYVGDEYGYTGPTGPILALHCARKKRLIKKGTNILMGAIGSGVDYAMCLFKC